MIQPVNTRLGGKMRLVPLIGATYFMVSGGPYGLEDIIGKAGYARALLLLLFIPFVWSFPTSLMVGELASAIPEEGGYYCWVRRALGAFWGFQEAWLSLAASVFDMAIYPVTFVLYLSRVAPSWTAGPRGTLWALAIVVACVAWNLRGARAVGEGSIGMFAALLTPFAVLVVIGLCRAMFAQPHYPLDSTDHVLNLGERLHRSFALLKRPVAAPDFAAALSVALWNYMGWDNASTIAQEVDSPRKNYPRAMLLSAALVAITYIVPLASVGLAGIPADRFSTGAWTDAARSLGGPWLAVAVVAGGMISGVGMFNALMMSYTRVPYALAKEGMLPAFVAKTTRPARSSDPSAPAAIGVPWVSILLCALGWALALQLSFERLISIDLVLYGAALLLEFVALVVLRLREPSLPRPFRIPGGLPAAVAAGIFPALLIGFALYAARNERVGPLPALVFAALVAAVGPLVYLAARRSWVPLPPGKES